MSNNMLLDSHSSFDLLPEELVLGYIYDDIYYEITYTPLISDDYNNFEVGKTTKIKINPQKPQEIV